ncbi:MAG: T9SS type A sorting domain-containing protein [Ignavibacteria bacterium]|nr:T9SS type A sorting domain-containing protein [Ignavibacteria bacterium]
MASQTGISQRKANCELSIYGSLKIDVCGNENQRRFILVMSIGNVLRSDSLFGFNFQISYSKDKVKITDALYINTLAEFFDTKAVSINSKEGKITGYAILMGMHPVYGNRPLIAFNGLWISECPDTAIFSVDFIEFTDEFKINIDSLKPTMLYGEVLYSKDKVFELKANKDTISSKDSSVFFDINVKVPKNSRLNEFRINVISDFDAIKIDSVRSLGNDIEFSKYQLMGIDKIDTFKTFFNVKYDSGKTNVVRFYITNNKPNEFVKIIFEPEYDKNCKCVYENTNDTLLTFYEKIINNFKEENNFFEIDLVNNVNIIIYDMIGRIVKELDFGQGFYGYEELESAFKNLPKGIYYVVLFNKNKRFNKREIYVNY